MDTALLYLAAGTFIIQLLTSLEMLIGSRTIKQLKEFTSEKSSNYPKVSIVFSARDEEKHIKKAVESMLNQDYPDFEVIAINDRSSDQTKPILDNLSDQHPHLQVIHIDTLPKQWLGKTHGLYQGTKIAQGDILLFTDADIIMSPDTLKKSTHYFETTECDHLAITPIATCPNRLLEMFVGTFLVYFSLFSLPWRAANPKSRWHIGVGAFNMIKSDVYQAIGTHQAIALCSDDDMKLGKRVKSKGFTQRVAYGKDLIKLEWYSSLRECIHGLTKNSFAGLRYSIMLALLASFTIFTISIFPYIGLWFLNQPGQWFYLAVITLQITTYATLAREHNIKPWLGLFFCLTSGILIYIIWRSVFMTLYRNGVVWRNTHTNLKDLKAFLKQMK